MGFWALTTCCQCLWKEEKVVQNYNDFIIKITNLTNRLKVQMKSTCLFDKLLTNWCCSIKISNFDNIITKNEIYQNYMFPDTDVVTPPIAELTNTRLIVKSH